MKSTSILFVALITLNIKGQNFTPVPDSNAYWMFSIEDSEGVMGHYGVFMPKYKQDTLINGKHYLKAYKFEKHYLDVNISYLCSFRTDSTGNKSFAVPPNEIVEYNLINTNLSVGESIDSVIIFLPPTINCFNHDSIIKANGTVQSYGVEQIEGVNSPLLDLNIHFWNDTNFSNTINLSWSGYYLFRSGPFNVPGGFCFQNAYTLCVSINDTVVYNFINTFNQDITPPNVGTCSNCMDLLTSIKRQEDKRENHFIYSNNTLIFKETISLKIIDLYGNVVFDNPKNQETKVDISTLHKGIYIVNYGVGDYGYTQKVIVE